MPKEKQSKEITHLHPEKLLDVNNIIQTQNQVFKDFQQVAKAIKNKVAESPSFKDIEKQLNLLTASWGKYDSILKQSIDKGELSWNQSKTTNGIFHNLKINENSFISISKCHLGKDELETIDTTILNKDNCTKYLTTPGPKHDFVEFTRHCFSNGKIGDDYQELLLNVTRITDPEKLPDSTFIKNRISITGIISTRPPEGFVNDLMKTESFRFTSLPG